MSYEVKCDICKVTIRRTDDVRESYAGGTCEECDGHHHFLSQLLPALEEDAHLRDMQRKYASLQRDSTSAGESNECRSG